MQREVEIGGACEARKMKQQNQLPFVPPTPMRSHYTSEHFSPKEKQVLYNFHFILNRELSDSCHQNCLTVFSYIFKT